LTLNNLGTDADYVDPASALIESENSSENNSQQELPAWAWKMYAPHHDKQVRTLVGRLDDHILSSFEKDDIAVQGIQAIRGLGNQIKHGFAWNPVMAAPQEIRLLSKKIDEVEGEYKNRHVAFILQECTELPGTSSILRLSLGKPVVDFVDMSSCLLKWLKDKEDGKDVSGPKDMDCSSLYGKDNDPYCSMSFKECIMKRSVNVDEFGVGGLFGLRSSYGYHSVWVPPKMANENEGLDLKPHVEAIEGTFASWEKFDFGEGVKATRKGDKLEITVQD